MHNKPKTQEPQPDSVSDQPPVKIGGCKTHRVRNAVLTLFALLLIGANVVLAGGFNVDVYFVASLSLGEQSLELYEGESQQILPDIVSVGAGEPELSWNSTDSAVCTVDVNGLLTALSPGSASVSVLEKRSGKTAERLIVVHKADEIVLEHGPVVLGSGESYSILARFGSDEAGNASVNPAYESSDPSLLSVTPDGVVTALSAGSGSVVVKAKGFKDAECAFSILAAPTALSTDTDGSMCEGEKRSLVVSMSDLEYCSAFDYTSDNPAVATVDENGLVTALSKGKATIAATAQNGVSCSLAVDVGDAAGDIALPKKLTVYNGMPVSLGASDSTGRCREFYYTSSDPEVLAVDQRGVASVLKEGSATVTCASYNGKSAVCEVTAKIVNYTVEYSSTRVYENIKALERTYPDIISTEVIGSSVQGRDISLLKLGKGEKKVLIVAGMHSKEDIAVTFTMRCISEYAAAYTAGKNYDRYNVVKLLKEYTMYFVPLMNPDGLDIAFGLCRAEFADSFTEEELTDFKNNANGVNLNRNFPFLWGEPGVNTTKPDSRSYAGTSEASEPETKAIMALCADNAFEWMLDIHCKGHMIFYQDRVNPVTQRDNDIAYMLSHRCEFNLNDRSTRYEISGGMENWFRHEYGNPGICVELVPPLYGTPVNEYFAKKVMWEKTRFAFLMCLGL